MLEASKDILYRHTGLFPPKLPHVRELEALDGEMLETIAGLKTVCLFLGPNRNLTTLTGSVLALHPNCQVLSHAGMRVLPVEELNFLHGYSEEKFKRFCQFALVMSQNGDKGSFGGSVVMTHAFRNHKVMRRAFRKRYGRQLIKDRIDCLVWKEAHRVDDFIAENNVDLSAVLQKNEKLRLLMPVRNPLDIALSFSKKAGMRRNFFSELEAKDTRPLLDSILDKMLRAVRLQKKFPERVMIFFEDDIRPDLFPRMAKFLNLDPEAHWLRDAQACFDVQPSGYKVPDSLKEYYAARVRELFTDIPEAQARFNQYG